VARLANPALAERRRRQIIEAAVSCFRRRGFHQTTMAEICAAANISAGALYHYFGSKAEIIGAIVEEEREASNAAFLRTTEEKGLIEGLCSGCAEFFRKLTEGGDGALFADIVAESIRDDVISKQLLASDERGVALMASAVKAAQARGEIDPTLDPESAAHTLACAVEGIGLRRALMRDADARVAEAQFRAFLERYLSKRS
jgi:AcrR family transcriptional regulator